MSTSENQVKLQVRIHPHAARNEVMGMIDNVFHIKISAPPIKGKANQELVAFLSQVLGVNRSRISILKGETSKNKLVAISGLSEEEVREKLGGTQRLL